MTKSCVGCGLPVASASFHFLWWVGPGVFGVAHYGCHDQAAAVLSETTGVEFSPTPQAWEKREIKENADVSTPVGVQP